MIGACADSPPPNVEHPVKSRFLAGSVELLITRDGSEALCSGVLISPTKVATARHCTRGAARIYVYEPDSGHMALAVHVKEDPIQDRAEIQTLTAFTTRADYGDSLDERPVRMQGFGCSDGSRLEQRQALYYGSGDRPRQIVWAGRACHGDSGGGIWNADGRLAAIMTETGFVYDHGRKINIVVGELL
jgi:hypothetical protein